MILLENFPRFSITLLFPVHTVTDRTGCDSAGYLPVNVPSHCAIEMRTSVQEQVHVRIHRGDRWASDVLELNIE